MHYGIKVHVLDHDFELLFSLPQLEQLHVMGITNDAACLHALEATEGDLQAALEILMGGVDQ